MTDRSVEVRLRADISDFQRKMLQASAGAKAFTSNLEAADSRMAAIVQGALALTPALVPLGGLAVPAIAGLVSQLGFAAAAAGTTILAFQGVGDALDALNKYKLDPTAANFAKLQEKMETLGPAGQEFVFFLQSVRPELQELQNIAQEGLFPGMEDGINELLDLEPQLHSLIGTISGTLGDLMADAGANLNDPSWVRFFEYLDREATPTLDAMGRSLGNFVEGFANMMVEFDPMADSFTQGMLENSRAFREWTEGLESNESFQDFVDYIRDSGPQAMETLGALGNALVQLVKAAAPVGSALLPVLEGVADTFAAIADSSVGPALVAAAAGVGAPGVGWRCCARWVCVATGRRLSLRRSAPPRSGRRSLRCGTGQTRSTGSVRPTRSSPCTRRRRTSTSGRG